MCRRANRLLNVLLCAPVAAICVAASIAPSAHALAASDPPPPPYVVALDAGHGGSPDNAHPEQLFDSGAVGPNGLQEKDLTLDIVRRARALLEQDDVRVVLTRDRDTYIDITPRMQTAIDAGAQLFLSVHLNGYQDPAADGSLVLFPNDQSVGFATLMAGVLRDGLGSYGIASRGTMLRPEMWQHATMPTCTLEPLFLTNPDEAALVARDDVRNTIAGLVRSGLEKQAPAILQRRDQIEDWKQRHPGAALAPGTPSNPAGAAEVGSPAIALPGGVVAGLALLVALPLLLLRRAVIHLLAVLSAGFIRLVLGFDHGGSPPDLDLSGPDRSRLDRRREVLERARRREGRQRLGAYREL